MLRIVRQQRTNDGCARVVGSVGNTIPRTNGAASLGRTEWDSLRSESHRMRRVVVAEYGIANVPMYGVENVH